jgi:hypothetical protein
MTKLFKDVHFHAAVLVILLKFKIQTLLSNIFSR